MKAKGILACCLVLICAVLIGSAADKKSQSATSILMRQKLVYSQGIVEGIALEKYDLVITNGTRLWRMSTTNIWHVVNNDGYRQKTQKFQVDVAELIDAARAKQTQSMLEAYSKVSHDCVDCHQAFRRAQYIAILQSANTNKP